MSSRVLGKGEISKKNEEKRRNHFMQIKCYKKKQSRNKAKKVKKGEKFEAE